MIQLSKSPEKDCLRGRGQLNLSQTDFAIRWSLRTWIMLSSESGQLSQPPRLARPLWARMHLTGKLCRRHFQRIIWILFKVFSFHIHLLWKSGAFRFSSIASKYAFLGSKSPFKLEIQLLWSSLAENLLSEVASTALWMRLGKTKDMFAKFQPLFVITSLSRIPSSLLFKGP